MSIEIKFSNESKRENSTKQLNMTAATHNCNFKNGCSMLKPTLLLEIETNNFPDYTAFKIENRYYNILDITSVRDNLFEIKGEVDVLATYKTNILATTAYVIYDSATNSELVDNRLPMKTSKHVSAESAACPLQLDGGCYILSLTGSNGTTGIYKVNIVELATLIDDVTHILDDFFPQPANPPDPDDPDYSGVDGKIRFFSDNVLFIADRLKTAIGNFFGSGNIPENIRECRYIPFNRGTTLGPNQIYLGTYKTQTSLSKLNTNTIVDSANVTIPWQTSDYRRRSPFTDVYLYIPYIGMTKLSSENLVGQTSINVQYALCVRDGSMIVTVRSGSEVLGQYHANVSAAVPIGVSNISIPHAAQSIIQGAAAIASDSPAGLGLAALHFGDSVTPNFSCVGGLDGLAATAASQSIICYTVFHDTIVAPNTEINTIGAPTMAPKSLANLTNFVQTLGASVAGSMTADERQKINNMLDNGIFIE